MATWRARETFFTAAETADGRVIRFDRGTEVPGVVARGLDGLVYRDDVVEPAKVDGSPPELLCDVCGFVSKSVAGLAVHGRRHEDD